MFNTYQQKRNARDRDIDRRFIVVPTEDGTGIKHIFDTAEDQIAYAPRKGVIVPFEMYQNASINISNLWRGNFKSMVEFAAALPVGPVKNTAMKNCKAAQREMYADENLAPHYVASELFLIKLRLKEKRIEFKKMMFKGIKSNADGIKLDEIREEVWDLNILIEILIGNPAMPRQYLTEFLKSG
ncbi:MAG: hypothetical protein LBR41_00485, partial [Rickettsiales bacterium]|nr:hypothetical protein [Rickettsiales bacterium]